MSAFPNQTYKSGKHINADAVFTISFGLVHSGDKIGDADLRLRVCSALGGAHNLMKACATLHDDLLAQNSSTGMTDADKAKLQAAIALINEISILSN